MKSATKIVLGVGAAATVGGLIYYFTRSKEETSGEKVARIAKEMAKAAADKAAAGGDSGGMSGELPHDVLDALLSSINAQSEEKKKIAAYTPPW